MRTQPDGICPNCWRTARAQPLEVDRISCPHRGIRAVWRADAWEYRSYTARHRQPDPEEAKLAAAEARKRLAMAIARNGR